TGCASRWPTSCAPPRRRGDLPPAHPRPADGAARAHAVRLDDVDHAARVQVRADLLALRRAGDPRPRAGEGPRPGRLARAALQPVVAGRLRSGGTAVIFSDIVIWDQIVSALVWLLNHYHDALGSWGWSIVLLTFTIRLAMLPLTIRQFRSMAAMQVVQPKVKQLQNRYKGKTSREDKQKMQQELMQLYKEHNVNPFGSCLPLLVQAPVFIA